MQLPPKILVENTEDTFRTFANAYGDMRSEANASFSIRNWLEPLRALYLLQDFDPFVAVLTEDPQMEVLDDGEPEYDLQTHYAKGFLRQVAADIITHSYIHARLETVPVRVFDVLYDTPTPQEFTVIQAIIASGLGEFHPDIDYENDVIMTDRLGFDDLFCQLQLIYSIDPDTAHAYYRTIMEDGCPAVEVENENPLGRYDDAYVDFAAQFAGTILHDPLVPRSFADNAFLRLDELDEIGPEKENRFDGDALRELAETTTDFIDLSEFDDKTAATIGTALEL